MKYLICLLSLVTFALAESPKTASAERAQCQAFLDHTIGDQADVCLAYARGVQDALDGDLAWADTAHKSVSVGQWVDEVNIDQIVRVFAKYVDNNPAMLNHAAFEVFRKAAEDAGIYVYSQPGK